MSWYPSGQSWWPHPRLDLTAPQWQRDDWWRIWGWHGSDEYGNSSVYLVTGLLGGFVFFCELDFQRDVELPDPGMNKFIDRRYYPEDMRQCPSGTCPHLEKTEGCDGYRLL